MRVEEVIGQRMHERRTALKLTQETTAERITAHLNREWTRQAVSAGEKGKRSFTAGELVAIAHALGTTVAWLLAPPEGVDGVEIGDGAYLPAHMFVSALIPHLTSGQPLDGVTDAIFQLRSHARELVEAVGNIDADMENLDEQVAAIAARQVSLEPEALSAVRPVAVAVVTSAEGILIGRRMDESPPWGFISGEVEPGERAVDAAVREVKEEAGLTVVPGTADPIGQRIHPQTGRRLIYLAARPAGDTKVIVGDEAELAEVRWVGLAEAHQLMPDIYGPVRNYLARALADRPER